MKRSTCCNRSCRLRTEHDCTTEGALKLSDSGQSVIITCAATDKLEIWYPDKCDILTDHGDRAPSCDFVVRKDTSERPAILLELKSGVWSFGRVRDQFDGGFRTIAALKLDCSVKGLYVIAGEGPSGGTQGLGGLQLLHGLPMKHIRGTLTWN